MRIRELSWPVSTDGFPNQHRPFLVQKHGVGRLCSSIVDAVSDMFLQQSFFVEMPISFNLHGNRSSFKSCQQEGAWRSGFGTVTGVRAGTPLPLDSPETGHNLWRRQRGRHPGPKVLAQQTPHQSFTNPLLLHVLLHREYQISRVYRQIQRCLQYYTSSSQLSVECRSM